MDVSALCGIRPEALQMPASAKLINRVSPYPVSHLLFHHIRSALALRTAEIDHVFGCRLLFPGGIAMGLATHTSRTQATALSLLSVRACESLH